METRQVDCLALVELRLSECFSLWLHQAVSGPSLSLSFVFFFLLPFLPTLNLFELVEKSHRSLAGFRCHRSELFGTASVCTFHLSVFVPQCACCILNNTLLQSRYTLCWHLSSVLSFGSELMFASWGNFYKPSKEHCRGNPTGTNLAFATTTATARPVVLCTVQVLVRLSAKPLYTHTGGVLEWRQPYWKKSTQELSRQAFFFLFCILLLSCTGEMCRVSLYVLSCTCLLSTVPEL